ncbi:hypothetical protein EEL33_03685 [Muribaculaceae bacterium Isolate-037 (Harlan)]|nr:hypothetical protein EEL33_03685 [Muribaculaceae bacterium Isolate-037 (Harlan)]
MITSTIFHDIRVMADLPYPDIVTPSCGVSHHVPETWWWRWSVMMTSWWWRRSVVMMLRRWWRGMSVLIAGSRETIAGTPVITMMLILLILMVTVFFITFLPVVSLLMTITVMPLVLVSKSLDTADRHE